MDVQYLTIAVSAFAVALACLLFFFKFGIKEKSYEEALAEQRQQANALLGTRPKPKEKKIKKAKKLKEKQPSTTNEQEKSEDSDAISETNSTVSKPHVEFKEPEIIVPEKESAPTATVSKKRTKKEKVKPILINKDSVENHVLLLVQPVETPPANRFEELHPKDEFELLHSHIKEEQHKSEPVKEKQKGKDELKQEKPKQEQPAKEKSNKVKSNNATEQNKKSSSSNTPEPEPSKPVKKVNSEPEQKATNKKTVVETANKKVVVAAVSNDKKVAKAQNEVQQSVEDGEEKQEAVDSAVVLSKANGIVVNTGKEKKKKKSEFNTLQQLAGDKQAVNLTILLNLVRKAELSRSEVQILIDLLLNKQHEGPAIEDWSEGKSDPVQKLKKQLAEKEKLLQEEQEALIGAQNKLREIRTEQNAEKSQYLQKIRQLEETLQNKQIEIQAVNSRLHGQMQKLQAQLNDEIMNSRKIREEHSALIVQRQQMECRLAQTQEADAVIAQLRNEIQELTNQNSQFGVDLHNLREQSLADTEGHQNYIAQLKQQIASYQQDLNKFQKDLEQSNDFARQQEEGRVIVERHLDIARRQITEVETELKKIKTAYHQNLEDGRRFEIAEVKVRDLQQQKDDADRLIGKLRKELAESRAEIEKLQQQQTSGAIEQNKIHQVERLNLQNEITSLKSQLLEAETKLQTTKTTIGNLEESLSEQRNKNDELRKKNWKVMEALNAAESKREKSMVVDDAVCKARLEEQQIARNFLQRLFPEVEKLGQLSQNQWLVEVEKLVQNHISGLKQQTKTVKTHPDIAKLQAQIVTYKNIIDDTEGMLNKLQQHVEQQEINWRSQLKAKDSEIDNLKSNTLNKLQTNLESLEIELVSEKEERLLLQQQLERLKTSNSTQNDSTLTIERLSEEIDRLRAQLQEKQQNGNVNNIIQEENSVPKSQTLSTNGPTLIQHQFSYSSSADSSLTEVTIKPKNKKKKKKGNGN